MTTLAVSFDDVVAAQARIAAEARRTPVLTSAAADARTGAKLFFKCENLQRVGAFKFRGAYNAIAQFSSEQRARGVVAYSSGNHAQGIALAAKLLGVRAVIVMPTDSPSIKLEATRGYGAEVILYDRFTEDRQEITRKLAEERGLTLIPPYDHPHIMAGQGTLAKELFDEVGLLDVLITPLGGGGLISGCATVAKAMYPACKVYGVEPEAGNDGQQSLRSGSIVRIATPKTIADGAQTQFLGQYTFPVIQQRVDDILTATDDELVDTMGFLASNLKLVVEPTGCLAAAAAFGEQLELAGKRVGIVLSGGNIDMARFISLLQSGSVASRPG